MGAALRSTHAKWRGLPDPTASLPFEALWVELVACSPILSIHHTLRPTDLPEQIGRAERLIARIHAKLTGKHRHSACHLTKELEKAIA